MNNEINVFQMMRELNAKHRAKTGRTVGIACEKGLFCATEGYKEGRKYITNELTPMQSYMECFNFLVKFVGE